MLTVHTQRGRRRLLPCAVAQLARVLPGISLVNTSHDQLDLMMHLVRPAGPQLDFVFVPAQVITASKRKL